MNILTNFSVFPAQIEKLTDFAAVSPAQPKNTIVPNVDLNMYSRGLGTRHLLGGMDSSSRFVKVAFTLAHAPKSDDETESVTNFFNILHSVEQAKRLDEIEPGKFEYTMYSDCMNLDKGILYFTTYDNNQIDAVDMNS
ncbi:linear amide C-N hydrolase [Lactobacillus amylovorus]|uniref:linear amide C-N hydrolase n=1 Tax=Lactobacillus amylovorus TaxID=1604 RepID=UPI0021CAB4CE|nr:linear amide C-N hydrolase [Lactobacillus amylovorus]UXN12718.1 linear amide C-N hydrolase [Lactobacillus amylovorus]